MITYMHDEEFETLAVSGGNFTPTPTGSSHVKIDVKGGATVKQYVAEDTVSIAANAQAVGNSGAENNISFSFDRLS